MGGAPPPPLDFAPQGPKNRRNSAPWGRVSGGLEAPRINVEDRGVAGAPAHYPSPDSGVVPGRRAGSPPHPEILPTGRIRESGLAAVGADMA